MSLRFSFCHTERYNNKKVGEHFQKFLYKKNSSAKIEYKQGFDFAVIKNDIMIAVVERKTVTFLYFE
jgi:hypothetical protein